MLTLSATTTTITIATCVLCVMFALGGALALWASITNADWFFATSSARSITNTFKRTPARIFYGICGALILVAAVAIFPL